MTPNSDPPATETLARLEKKLTEAEEELEIQRLARGVDPGLCSMRAPSSAVDMGRVFGADRGTLVWVDASLVEPLVAMLSDPALGDLQSPTPGDSFVFCFSEALAVSVGGGSRERAPRFICTRTMPDGQLCVTAWEGGPKNQDDSTAHLSLGVYLTFIAVNARLFPILVSSRSSPVYDGTRKRGKPPEVTVISLCPRVGDGGTGGGDPRLNRWEVRGHWRMQPCGKGRAERRLVWINAHEKGPEGAPVLTRRKLYKL